MNNLTIDYGSEWLFKWRRRAGLGASQVDRRLGQRMGTTLYYERLGLLRVPCCEIAKMVDLYNVPHDEFYDIVAVLTRGLKKRL